MPLALLSQGPEVMSTSQSLSAVKWMVAVWAVAVALPTTGSGHDDANSFQTEMLSMHAE